MESVVALLQREVQRKLGRCMLRLQQYERLLKSMVASMALTGPIEQLRAVQDEQVCSMRNRTLGTLVGVFTGRYLTTASGDVEVGQGEDISLGNPAAPWGSVRFNISMSPELHAQTKAGLAELVDLRNDLVHHLIENFDISEVNGCRAASNHLDSCYEQIDGHYRTLKIWASSLCESQAQASTFLQSEAFEDAFVRGVDPDASVCWPRSPIVEYLREAETACQVGGWTLLDAAIRHISKKNRDQVPTKYGCKTWRQVLKRSGQFEARSVAGSNNSTGRTWYRSSSDNVVPG
jgi:hypothetical protein